MSLPQNQSRVTLQAALIDTLNNSTTSKVAVSLGGSVVVEAFFINEIDFPSEIEAQYQESTALSDSYEQSYETTELQYQKTRLQIQNVWSTIELLKKSFRFAADQAYAQELSSDLTTDLTDEQAEEARLSASYLVQRIWTVRNALRSTTTPLKWSSLEFITSLYSSIYSESYFIDANHAARPS